MRTDYESIEIMLRHIDRLLQYCENKKYSDFVDGTQFTDACVFNLIQIGEAVVNISPGFQEQYPEIPWRVIKNMRNKIVHDYDGVNYTMVWETISKDIPILKKQLSNIYNSGATDCASANTPKPGTQNPIPNAEVMKNEE